jgi:hypothetical protein
MELVLEPVWPKAEGKRPVGAFALALRGIPAG